MSSTNIFKVLSDSQRRDILVMLKNGRMNAGEIADRLGVTPAALSYHLKMLKKLPDYGLMCRKLEVFSLRSLKK